MQMTESQKIDQDPEKNISLFSNYGI